MKLASKSLANPAAADLIATAINSAGAALEAVAAAIADRATAIFDAWQRPIRLTYGLFQRYLTRRAVQSSEWVDPEGRFPYEGKSIYI
jgi:hypothetical protein